jgi:lysophospholipase L1-like esterase
MTKSLPISFAAALLLLAACGGEESGAPSADADVQILVVGDSALEWNEDESTPAALGNELTARGINAAVDNRSVGGSCLGPGCDDGVPIPDTYSDEGWDIVIIAGGANDIDNDGDATCGPIDGLIDAGLDSGVVVDLVNEVIDGGAHAVIYGYMLPLTEGFGIASCAEIHELLRRYGALADSRSGVTFVDANDVVSREQPEYYDDEVHPSPQGSVVIGAFLADTVEPLVS